MIEAAAMKECLALTSKSDQTNRIIEKIMALLINLYSYGFSKPRLNQEEWSTTLTLMLTDIALEVEIDWREFDVFVLVVRLENGEIPSGYYVSEGRSCRLHLQKVISDQKWSVDQKALAMISPGNKDKRKNTKRTEGDILDRFRAYKIVLDDCVESLVEKGKTIF